MAAPTNASRVAALRSSWVMRRGRAGTGRLACTGLRLPARPDDGFSAASCRLSGFGFLMPYPGKNT
jgi:hypothetical protein